MAEDTAAQDVGSSSLPAGAAADGIHDDSPDSSFQCCVCLDLLYKPVVLACGHISCFWCVHKAMHGVRTSHCAICRQPYNHFPNICHLLHHLLLKIAPVTYKRREKEVLDEEKRLDVFSPQILDDLISERVHSDKNKFDTLEGIEKSAQKLRSSRSISSGESTWPENGLEDGICKQISADDVLCPLCKELLFQPVVLNCGHVYCESCLSGLAGKPLKCQVCQSPHPGEFPNVCLDLDHFLEEQFPREFTMRSKKVQLEKVSQQLKDLSSNSLRTEEQNAELSSDAKKKSQSLFNEDLSNAHVGVGCDSCGIYPIIGKRYKCKDCKEAIGFDLCEVCYNTNSKLPGRFNQQHTPDHQFELDESQLLYKILRFRPLSPEGPHELPLVFVADDDPEGHDDDMEGPHELPLVFVADDDTEGHDDDMGGPLADDDPEGHDDDMEGPHELPLVFVADDDPEGHDDDMEGPLADDDPGGHDDDMEGPHELPLVFVADDDPEGHDDDMDDAPEILDHHE